MDRLQGLFGQKPSYTKGLRPLGNRKRLTQTADQDTYDVRLLLFREKESAEKYYEVFIRHAKNHPPPFLIEVMLLHIAKSIFSEKYAIAFPNEEVDSRPGYNRWVIDATGSCNEVLRFHNQTDHKYKALHDYVDRVYRWDILVPKNFSASSSAGKELLHDDPEGGFPQLNVTD